MNENGHDIQTILTKRTGFQADSVLHYGQSTKKKEKVDPSQKPKSRFFQGIFW